MNKDLLTGVKALNLTRALADPYCGMTLVNMGAEAVKTEMLDRGDDARKNVPIVNGESAYFMNLNRNKRGVTLNLKSEGGRRIFKEMAAKSDIILGNYRPGVMEKPGLGYEEPCRINPAIVYDVASGFGYYRPYSQRAGYDTIGQAMSGLMSTTGWPGGRPTRTGTATSDVMGGISCCAEVLAVYVNRSKTGEGDKVDVSPVDSMVSLLEIINMIYPCTDRVPDRIGSRYEVICPYDTFEASDGMVIIACGSNKLYGPLKEVLQIPELEGEEFGDNIKRVKNHAKLKPITEAWTTKKTINDVVETLLAVGIPASLVSTIDRVVKDPHIAGAREMFVELEHPVVGKMKAIGNQLKSTNNKTAIDTPAPLLGQHTEETLREFLGTSHEEYEKLTEEGVLQLGTERSV